MEIDNAYDWGYLVDPSDLNARLLIAVLHLLFKKEIIHKDELWRVADPSCQQLETEDNARRIWHTPSLPTEELAAMVDIDQDSVLLDAGTGFGGPARQLAETFGCRVIGIDRDPLRVLHAIRQTRRMGLGQRVSFCWGVFENLPFPDQTFDVVWVQASVTRYDKEWHDGVPTGMDVSVFNEFNRVLRYEGQLACQVWIKGPVTHADLAAFLALTGFSLSRLDDCTRTWLESIEKSVKEPGLDLDQKDKRQKAYEERLSRKDKLFRFTATKPIVNIGGS
jgi:ubiquinone/menaquinone biosynthesis C-methylase UbiE